ncbi:Ig-like domain-containing protein [Novosphingobium sp. BL-52-GroH]|uniref:Ig-like domain-containing protein n=1 Tax=Novosphingobium sp. BL-52-GroH TaxID=3349877 RepID=UPI00384C7FD8
MPVEAKISPTTSGINTATVQAVEGSVSVPAGSSVALNVAPAAVAGYTRDGTDLLVHLKSGEVIRVANFYLDPTKVSHLLLVQNEELVAADIGQATGSALSSATYVPIDAAAGFQASAAVEAAGAAAGAGGAGLGAGALIPLGVLGVGGLAVAAAGGGGGNDEPVTPPDTTAPAAATGLAINTAGTSLTGSAEAGATVNVDLDGNGTTDISATVGANGTFAVALSPPLLDGETVSVMVRDAAGNTSPAATVTAPDTTAPAAAQGVAIAADGASITGTGEPGATAQIDVDGDGAPDYSATIAANGTFTIALAPALDNGQQISVTLVDGAGNISAAVLATAPDLSPLPTTAPVIDPTDGTFLAGTATSGTAVLLTDAAGATIGQAAIAADGIWSFIPSTPLADGTIVTATAVNRIGEAGPGATAIVDALAPPAPVIAPSNGGSVTGSAEAGAIVLISNEQGTPIGQATVDAGGAWTFTPVTPFTDGTVVIAVARDAAGNTSPTSSITVDAVAPATPAVTPPNGVSVSGTAEPGSTVLLIDAGGDPIGQVIADTGGTWTFAPTSPFADGAVLTVVARDAAGNASAPASATVDAAPPEAPTIAPTSGEILFGTAEPGSLVTLSDGDGNPIAQVSVDAAGDWTFTPASPLGDGTVVEAAATDAVGNTSAIASTTVDATPPAAPEIYPTDGSVISGTAEPGVLVSVFVESGDPIGEATADADGHWTFTLDVSLPHGAVIHAHAQDPAGNQGPQASATVDSIAPDAPTVEATNGSLLAGTAEPGTTVMLTDSDGTAIGETIVDDNGDWTFLPNPSLVDGTVVSVVAQDAAGNASMVVDVTVDAAAPAAPTIDPSNGAVLSGSAEDGSIVTLTDGDGDPIGQVTAYGSGNWSFTPGSPLPDGTVVNAVATDAVGNTSPPSSTTVDFTPPAAPAIDPTDGSTITGTSEPGALVTLTDDDGDPIGQVRADSDGAWIFTPGVPLPDGTIVNAFAQDAAGNVGPEASVTTDAIAPPAPTIDPTNGTVIAGTAEAGSTILLTDENGDPIGETLTNQDGDWTFTTGSPLPDGTVVNAVARDAAGNTSLEASTTVDAAPPAPPSIDPGNGAFLIGQAEIGVVITLADGSGALIGQTSTDGSGNWAFAPSVPLPDGTVVVAVASDTAGNASTPTSTTVDAVSPPAPTIDATNGSVLSGTAEADATVTLTDGSGNSIGQTVADGDGAWSFVPDSPLPDGTVVNAAATDAAGNTGPQASTTVDAVAPAAPVIDPSDGSTVTGLSEAGTLLVLTDADGNPLGQVTADIDGAWSFTPASPLPEGFVVNAIAQDAAGNTSPQSSTTVDTTPPAEPTIDPTNGSQVTGTAEPNSTVILMDGTGNASARVIIPQLGLPLGQVFADEGGNWIFTPLLPLPDGTVVIAISVDAAGNVSSAVNTTVDGEAPLTPTIDPTSGLALAGTAEAGVTVLLTDALGDPIGQATADEDGNWTFAPLVALVNGTVVDAVAVDEAGNESPPATITVDSIIPAVPLVNASNGTIITGTAEPDSTVVLTDGFGNPIGTATVDGNGDWSFTPEASLLNATVVIAVAQDATGNTSGPTAIVVDALAPASPFLSLLSNGSLLSGTAEPNSRIEIVIDGDTANPIVVNVDGSGNFSFPLSAPIVLGETISAVAVDAAGNTSLPTLLVAPDIAPPTLSVPEAADGFVNATEIDNGIQVEVAVRPTMQVGQVVTAQFNGQGNYQVQATHTLTTGDILVGAVILSIVPTGGLGALPDGASTIVASVGGGAVSSPVAFTIDTTPPPAPIVALTSSVLTISADPGTDLTVNADVGGTSANTVVTADENGLASVNLLTGLNVGLGWNDLLTAEVTVTGKDKAGNPGNVATIDVDSSIQRPVTIGNLALDVSLNPLNPRFGFSGTTEPDSTVVIRVVTPVLNVELLPVQADSSGHFDLNLLSPTILTQLGLNITDILNLGAQISFGVVSTDPQGNESSAYVVDLGPNGLSLNIGQVDVNGTVGDDVMSGSVGTEHINSGSGNDLIFDVGAGDHVAAGPGHDTVQLTATNFSNADGGTGFDTVLLANGIDLDYGVGVGTFTGIERFDLGSGDSGSVLTLTASEVTAITSGNNTLQITGESNDALHVTGAVDTGTTQQVEGVVYHVYSFGVNTLLVEDNTIQVVV